MSFGKGVIAVRDILKYLNKDIFDCQIPFITSI